MSTTTLSQRLRDFSAKGYNNGRFNKIDVDALLSFAKEAEAQEAQAVGRMPNRGPEWCAEVKKRWREREARIMSRSQPNEVKPSRTLDTIDDLLEYIAANKVEAQAGELSDEQVDRACEVYADNHPHNGTIAVNRTAMRRALASIRPSQAIGEQTPVAWMHKDYCAFIRTEEKDSRHFDYTIPLGILPISPEARYKAINVLEKRQKALDAALKYVTPFNIRKANEDEFLLVCEALSALRK